MSAETSLLALKPPEGWRESPLVSVAELRFSSVDKLTHGSEEPVRLCNYMDVYSNDYITGEQEFMQASATEPEIRRFGLKVGDVIITKDSETPDDIAIPAIVDYAAPDLVCGYHLALIRPNTEEVDSTFLAKQLAHYRLARYFGKEATGLTRYGLPIGAVNNAPLWLPELLEQKSVAIILRLVDEAIAKTEAVIAKQHHVRAGVIHDLLTIGLDEDGQIRDPVVRANLFRESPLGFIPRDWIVAPLAHFLSSAEYGISTSLKSEGALPVLRMNNLVGGEAELSDVKFATCEVSRSLYLRSGDVLFNRTNSYEHVGKTCIWRGQLPRATFASYLVRLNPAAEKLISEYLNLLLNLPDYQLRMRRFATPAVQQVNINPTSLQQMLVAIPNTISEQERIVACAQEYSRLIGVEKTELTKLVFLKSGLTDDLLTGRVRVP